MADILYVIALRFTLKIDHKLVLSVSGTDVEAMTQRTSDRYTRRIMGSFSNAVQL